MALLPLDLINPVWAAFNIVGETASGTVVFLAFIYS